MGNEFKGSLQDQEGRLDVFEKDRCDIKEKVSDLELELATKFGPGHEADLPMSQLGDLQQIRGPSTRCWNECFKNF